MIFAPCNCHHGARMMLVVVSSAASSLLVASSSWRGPSACAVRQRALSPRLAADEGEPGSGVAT